MASNAEERLSFRCAVDDWSGVAELFTLAEKAVNVSPAYAEEYREWIRRGQFQSVYGWAVAKLPESLKQEHPALIAGDLGSIATCYYTRGIVALLDGDQAGWHDIQCGYWAVVQKLRFEIKSITLPA